MDESTYRIIRDAKPDRCAFAHAASNHNYAKSGARTRQIAQHRVDTVCAYESLMLALDRRVLDIPVGERLRTRTFDLVTWAKIIFPVVHQSIRDA
jgi:hypothetical protein